MVKFYDTSSLLMIEENEKYFVYSSITLEELEHIKQSSNVDEELKYKARKVVTYLEDHGNCVFFKDFMLKAFENSGLSINNDLKILSTAIYLKEQCKQDIVFYTNDILLKILAKNRGMPVEQVRPQIDDYNGFLEVEFSPEEWEDFYYHMTDDKYAEKLGLYTNEYLYIKNSEQPEVYRWTGEEFCAAWAPNFNSRQLGNIKPVKNDIYQLMAADSLTANTITMIKGPAGSGKSTLALGYLFYMLEKGKINKIIVFCNTVATKNSAKLGFYPGSRQEKLLDSSIGNFLASKLGDRLAVEKLCDDGRLVLLPMADIRGYDTSGMNAGVYIPEAQNLDITLIKLALSRIGNDSICIIDGDIESQVDLTAYEGIKNGMRRVSKVFRGHDFYGEVTLQEIHRGTIAEVADLL